MKEALLDTGGFSCRVLYRMSGLESSSQLLLQLVREFLPVTSLSIICTAQDLSTIIPVADTDPKGLSTIRHRTPGRVAPLIGAHSLSEPLLINDLTPYQVEQRRKDPENADLPFMLHKSVLRLPLFRSGAFIFMLNFWADVPAAFRVEHIDQLVRLTEPLAEELQSNFSGFNNALPHEVKETSGYEHLCRCAGLSSLRKAVERVAPTRSTVLIVGETGVGKESVAEALHELSGRKDRPFVKVNCGAIAESLVDSELFGHEKGAFTGAHTTRSGFFELADGGTLFLDEIGELPLASQVRLLRVLDSKCIQRVGNPRAIPVDVRVVAATNADLTAMVQAKTFRQDLYYRLSVYPLVVPPLRRRKMDIPTLAQYFAGVKSRDMGVVSPVDIPVAEMDKLYVYEWPGNVRELEHVVERALIDARSLATLSSLSFDLSGQRHMHHSGGPGSECSLDIQDWPSLAELNERYIERVLGHCQGKLTGSGSASEVLGIHYTTLRAHLKKKAV